MEKVIVAVFTSVLCSVMSVSDSKEDCGSKEETSKPAKEVIQENNTSDLK